MLAQQGLGRLELVGGDQGAQLLLELRQPAAHAAGTPSAASSVCSWAACARQRPADVV